MAKATESKAAPAVAEETAAAATPAAARKTTTKKATEKKTTAEKKAEAEVEEKKEAAPKKGTAAKKEAAPKKPAARKRTAKNEAEEVTVYIQFAGKEVLAKEILKKAKDAFAAANEGVEIKTIDIYVKPEENAAYYVVNGAGSEAYKIEL